MITIDMDLNLRFAIVGIESRIVTSRSVDCGKTVVVCKER